METYQQSLQKLNNLFSIKSYFINYSFDPNPALEEELTKMLDGAIKSLSIIWNRLPEEIIEDLETL